ncbi:hypothetical protein [Streptomyces sp. NPDC051211]|uniref:hypothetical protein n=1 Tax=Streptomyces sp. NPDC051211 TaxID=3154643 RepID=UPI00344B5AF5
MREPNGQLRTLLTEARWSGQDFARAVNGVAAETGLSLRYDRTSVSHWLAGTRPPAHIAALAAEALTRRTGRRISAADTGLARARPRAEPEPARSPASPIPPAPATPLSTLTTLSSLASLGEVPVYSSTWRPPGGEGPPPGEAAGPESGERIGVRHIQAAEAVLPVFRSTDLMCGSGLARPALTRYLATTVAPWLRAAAPPSVRHRLLGCTARLAYTAGFLCFDSNQHGVAQAYYRAALRLGQEAGDPGCSAPALRAMSVQAHYLGHRRQAVELAEAAARDAGRLPALQAAFVTGQLAVAEAACGDRRAALTHLGTAGRLLERAAGQTAPIGDYHRAALAHQQAEALAALGDLKGAVAALASSLRHRPAGERRARAVTTARLAELHLDRGHLERACATAHELWDLAPQLDSARVTAAVRRLRARLRVLRTTPVVRTLLDRT